MPDTPRTVAELKALFADNSSGEISAQDLRDFVVSSMVDPADRVFMLVANNASPDGPWDVNTTLPLEPASPFASYIPSGWSVDDATVGEETFWGFSFAPGSVLVLPRGVYTWEVQTSSTVTLNQDESLNSDWDFAADPSGLGFDGQPPAGYGSPLVTPNPTSPSNTGFMQQGTFVASEPDTRMAAFIFGNFNAHPTAKVYSYLLRVFRIA